MVTTFVFSGVSTMNDLWQKTIFHLDKGNFSALEQDLGGPVGFDRHIVEWHVTGKFDDEPELLAEALSCACMLGRTETARYLFDAGVDPYAGMKTWLAGPHYAVSGGKLDVMRMLLDKNIDLEVENKYRGTLLGQALWSAVNEHKSTHAEIIECLLEAGARVELGTIDWWAGQSVPSDETKQRALAALQRYDKH